MDKNNITLISLFYKDEMGNYINIRIEDEYTIDIFIKETNNPDDIILSVSLKELKVLLNTIKSDYFNCLYISGAGISKPGSTFIDFDYYDKDEDETIKTQVGITPYFKCFCEDALNIIGAL